MKTQKINKATNNNYSPEFPIKSEPKSSSLKFMDNRSAALISGSYQAMVNDSHQVKQLMTYQAMANLHSAQTIKYKNNLNEKKIDVLQKKDANKGLPTQLKSSIAQLSGITMDDVKVYYNSSCPAQLQAHAYAQGTDIHLAPGQEKHLPHEAWHVVQQKQGRVSPTLQLKNGVNINDDIVLENEADRMGAKALQTTLDATEQFISKKTLDSKSTQLKSVIQLETTVSGHGGLRRNEHDNHLVPFQVPQGKTIILAAPPGATLGDVSLILNTATAPNLEDLRSLVKINTTKEIWTNIAVVQIIMDDASIIKTQFQVNTLNDLTKVVDRIPYADLSGPKKGALTVLESKQSFESWADAYVRPQTFKVLSEGENMTDMTLAPFEPGLRSANSAAQNHYVDAPTTLSDYVANHQAEHRFIINACSHDSNAAYTGFQIDKL